jgi:protein-disulfide isomerase
MEQQKNGLEAHYVLSLSIIVGFLILGIFLYLGFDNLAQPLKESAQITKNAWEEQKNYQNQIQEQLNQYNDNSKQQQTQTAQDVYIGEFDLKIDNRPIRGEKNSKIVLVSYEEFVCPYCQRNYPVLKNLEEKYPQMSFIHMNYVVHPEQATISSIAVECAGDQGKYWEYFDKTFQTAISSDGLEKIMSADGLKDIAKSIGLNMPKFEECLQSDVKKQSIDAQMQAGKTIGVYATPSFVLFEQTKNEDTKQKLLKTASELNQYGLNIRVLLVKGKGYGLFFSGALPQEYFEYMIDSILS